MMFTDDPARDWDTYMAECDERMAKLPVCSVCGDPIQDEYLYRKDGENYCDVCFTQKFAFCDEPRGCECCGRTSDYYYIIDGSVLCEECADDEHREENYKE